MKPALVIVHALSPLHAGTGQGVGSIDLPTAREKATGIPYLPGSSIKGALRDLCVDGGDRHAIFGPETDRADERAGAAQFADARLLLLPVRSLAGTFAWTTSPYVLGRLLRDAGDAQVPSLPAVIPAPRQAACEVARGTALTVARDGVGRVFLEDLDLESAESEGADAWAAWIGGALFPADDSWQRMLTERLCVVHDDVMGFLLDTALEVVTRVSLKDESKTVGEGPWYEENLPAETVLHGLVLAGAEHAPRNDADYKGMSAQQVLEKVTALTQKRHLQLGGKATVGRGLCRITVVSGEA